MKLIRRSTQFKKDYKRVKKSGKNLAELKQVINKLADDNNLEPKYHDHVLIGNYAGCRECHLEPDWLLIYRTSSTELSLVRTGSHSELF
jgi:mRNA interferase YafQ